MTELKKNTPNNVLRPNPSLMFEKLEQLAAEHKKLQSKYYKEVTAKIMEETSCEFEVNDYTNKLFDPKNYDHYMEKSPTHLWQNTS
jgi:hypothetical protein